MGPSSNVPTVQPFASIHKSDTRPAIRLWLRSWMTNVIYVKRPGADWREDSN
jgi:hypothetical protein